MGVFVNMFMQSDAAKEAFVKTHISKENVNGRNGGAHIDYLEW